MSIFTFNPFMTEAVIYRNQSTDLRIKSMDWFLYYNGLRHERVKRIKGTAIATFVCFCNFYIQRIYFGFGALTMLVFFFCKSSNRT